MTTHNTLIKSNTKSIHLILAGLLVLVGLFMAQRIAQAAPIITEPLACSSYTYNAWGPCQDTGFQSRTVRSARPARCVDQSSAITERACTPTCSAWTYGAWGACQANNTQTRTATPSYPPNCAGGSPVTSQSCTYTAPTCSAWTYGAWGVCQPNNTQTRTATPLAPSGCAGGSPATSQGCTFTGAENLSVTVRSTYMSVAGRETYFTWVNAHPGLSYEIERATTAGGPFTRVATVSGSVSPTMTYTVTGESAPGVYYYRIKTPSFGNIISEEVRVNLVPRMLLSGNAWADTGSSGIGWISLSCETGVAGCSAGNKYNVYVNSDNTLSGVAWASGGFNAGWLSFNGADLAGCPSGGCVAQLDMSSNPKKLKGWAKFIGATSTTGSSWTGWVSLNSEAAVGGAPSSVEVVTEKKSFSLVRAWSAFMNKGNFKSVSGWREKIASVIFEANNISRAFAQAGVSYGVAYDSTTSRLTGRAWGGNVVGWIDVNAIVTELPPVVANPSPSEGPILDPDRTGTGGTWCDETPYYVIRWNYSSPSNSGQGGADITFYNGNTVLYTTSTTSSAARFNFLDPLRFIPANTTFSVGVKVRDIYGLESLEVRSPSTITTPARYYPFVQFTWTPVPARTGWPINFSGTSTLDRSGGTVPRSELGWRWTFPHATSTVGATSEIATTIFSPATATSSDRVTLTVTDGGVQCSLSQQVLGGTGVQPKKIRGIQER